MHFRMSPDDYRKLTHGEIVAFWEMATPKTDLTGLF